MFRSTIRFILSRYPWLLRPFANHRWRRSIDRTISSGEFDPAPNCCVHFPDYERSDASRHIPLIFHQTSRTTIVPPRYRGNRDRLVNLHPTPPWQHQYWTDEDIIEFVKRHFPHYLRPFQLLPKPIMRVDIFRYMLLSIHGGVYADLDFRLFKPIDDVIADCTLLLPAESDNQTSQNFLAQHFLASCPGHVFWEDCLKACLERSEEAILACSDPLVATGPIFVTRVWRNNPEKYGAKITKRVFLAPPTGYWFSGLSMPELSYGVHECHGTWR
jgi:mannosyltransferase OCH1-like enzyme